MKTFATLPAEVRRILARRELRRRDPGGLDADIFATYPWMRYCTDAELDVIGAGADHAEIAALAAARSTAP